MQIIAVIDYGMGNLRSVAKAIECVADDHNVLVTSNPQEILSADKIVCPGQGAAADCMSALSNANLIEPIKQVVGTRPFLGICMGLQVLLTASDENNGVACMNIIPGHVHRFSNPLLSADGERLKVPHMGWSKVSQTAAHPMWQGIENDARFYFAHSYYCKPKEIDAVVGSCFYGHEFSVVLAQRNLFACQFHPEKSAKDGLQLLKNFVSWNGAA